MSLALSRYLHPKPHDYFSYPRYTVRNLLHVNFNWSYDGYTEHSLSERTESVFAEEMKKVGENQKLDIRSLGQGLYTKPLAYGEAQPLERDVL
jgi:hypothetical protein